MHIDVPLVIQPRTKQKQDATTFILYLLHFLCKFRKLLPGATIIPTTTIVISLYYTQSRIS